MNVIDIKNQTKLFAPNSPITDKAPVVELSWGKSGRGAARSGAALFVPKLVWEAAEEITTPAPALLGH